MSRRSLGLVAAMESLDSDSPDVSILVPAAQQQPEQKATIVVEVSVLPNGAELAENDIMEVEEVNRDADELEDQIEGTLVIRDRLVDMGDTVENAIAEQDGLSDSSVEVLTSALEHFSAYLGAAKLKVPALEDFQGSSARYYSSKIALESIQEVVKKATEAVIAAIRKALQYLEEALAKIQVVVGAMRLRARNLERLLEGLSGQPNARNVLEERLARSLAVNGMVPSAFVRELKKFRDVTEGVFNVSTDWTLEHVEKLKNAIRNDSVSVSDLTELSGLSFEGLEKASNQDTPEGLTRYSTPALFGNRSVEYLLVSASSEIEERVLTKSIQSVGGRVVFNEPTRQPSAQLPILSVEDLKAVIGECLSILETIEGFKKRFPELKRLGNELIAAAQASAREALKGENVDSHRLDESILLGASRLIREPARSYSSYAIDVVRQLLNYVELCSKSYIKN